MSRFITQDTIVTQPYNPQSLNRYSYCLNNPLRYTDPSGHVTEDELKKAGYVQDPKTGEWYLGGLSCSGPCIKTIKDIVDGWENNNLIEFNEETTYFEYVEARSKYEYTFLLTHGTDTGFLQFGPGGLATRFVSIVDIMRLPSKGQYFYIAACGPNSRMQMGSSMAGLYSTKHIDLTVLKGNSQKGAHFNL